jgi:hypothetical protein
MQVLVPVDFNDCQLQNAVLENLTDDPADTTLGRIFFNTSQLSAKVWNGKDWAEMGQVSDTAPTPNTLALRDGAGSLTASLFYGILRGSADTAGQATESLHFE